MTLFDYAEAERRKEEGMERAMRGREWHLRAAQDIAVSIGRVTDDVDSDMVAMRMTRLGLDYEQLGNAAGCVFKSPPAGFRWVFSGKVRRSQRASTHGRMIRVWNLRRVQP